MVHAISVLFTLESEADIFVIIQFDGSFVKGVNLKLLIVSMQLNDLVGDIFKDEG